MQAQGPGDEDDATRVSVNQSGPANCLRQSADDGENAEQCQQQSEHARKDPEAEVSAPESTHARVDHPSKGVARSRCSSVGREEKMTSAFALVTWYAPRDSNPEPAD